MEANGHLSTCCLTESLPIRYVFTYCWLNIPGLACPDILARQAEDLDCVLADALTSCVAGLERLHLEVAGAPLLAGRLWLHCAKHAGKLAEDQAA